MTTRETWTGPSTEERIEEIKVWAKRIAEYTAKRTDWHEEGAALDGLAIASEDLGRKMTRLRHHLGRCTRGHIIGPTNACPACGAMLTKAAP